MLKVSVCHAEAGVAYGIVGPYVRCTDEIQGTLTMNGSDILTATHNTTKWRDLIYKAVENRKRQNE
jgi:hypothetical protein